jgi:hypothetical protein
MKPRWSLPDETFETLLKDAQDLEERLEKSSPDFGGQKEGSKVGPSHFETEVGGGTSVRNSHYNTNGVPIEIEDVKAKKPKKENVNLDIHNPQLPSTLSAHLTEGKGAPLKKAEEIGGNLFRYKEQEIRKSLDKLSRRLI